MLFLKIEKLRNKKYNQIVPNHQNVRRWHCIFGQNQGGLLSKHFRFYLNLLHNMLGNFTNIRDDFTLIFNQEEKRMEKPLCHICSRSGEEIKVVLHFIRKRLKKISNQYIPDYRDQCDASTKPSHAFGRLLGIIMGGNTAQPSFHACPHQKFSRYLRRKLKCDNATFHDLCNELVQKMAQRNYQIQVLNMQLKNLSETCLELSQQPEAEAVRAMDEQKREAAQRTYASFPSERMEMRMSESAFMQPMFNQFSGAFAPIPVIYMSLGVSPQEIEGQIFPRNDTN